MIPIMIACDASEAKAFPCSKARKNATGPEVNGSPTSQPLTVGPQRRPARLTPPMNVGTKNNLRRKVTQSMLTPLSFRRLAFAAPRFLHRNKISACARTKSSDAQDSSYDCSIPNNRYIRSARTGQLCALWKKVIETKRLWRSS